MRSSIIYICSLLFVFAGCKKQCANSATAVSNAIAVDAGKSQIVTVSGDTAWLNGTVLNGRPSINNFSWTKLSGPNNPIIAHSDSLSTLTTGLTIGTYIFQLKASSADNVGLDTTTVQVAKHLTIRIDSTSRVFYFILLGTTNTSGYDHSPDLLAEWWTNGGLPYDVKSCFIFDLSPLPLNASIVSARLTLYSDSTPLNGDHLGDANSGINNAFYIARVTASWDTTSTWFAQPSIDTASQILIPTTTLPQLDLTKLDVTSMVDSMRINNYGFEMRLQDEVALTTRIFCSGFYTEASRHPQLDIYYQ